MRILYIGDVMAAAGIETVERVLPELRQAEQIDVVIAQAENVTDGKGMSRADYERLRQLGIDGFSGGNHSIDRAELFPLLVDADAPVVGPANMHDCPGPGYKYVNTDFGKVLIISLLGQIVGKDADKPVDNPLRKIDEILESQKAVPRIATIVNFHGDFSSEKVIIGHYLDGRVSVVVGDHWHTPTNDARVLPKGTAHQTDVGMCGALEASLGVTYDSVIPRWRDGTATRNIMEMNGPRQFNALLVEVDERTGLATDARAIRKVLM